MTGMRCERWARLLLLVAVLPLLLGAGGGNPGIPTGTKIGGFLFKASVVIDPHNAVIPGDGGPATTTAGQASIRLYRDPLLAAAIFEVPVLGFPLAFGCDLSKTDARFLNVPLINWIPEDVLNQLFVTLKNPRNAHKEPVITRIESDACTPDPANPTPSDGSHPGILSFQADVRFLVPR